MKTNKYIIFILFLILLFPLTIKAKECKKENIQIEKIELTGTTGNAEETTMPSNDSNQINLNAKMNVLGDTLTYKVTIRNTSDSDYVFDQEQITEEFINYDISYEEDGNIIKAGEEKVIYLTLNYTNKPETDDLLNGVYTSNDQVSFNLVDGSNDFMNPETRSRTLNIFFIVLLVTTISTVMVRKNKRTMGLILILSSCMIPQIVHAVCTCTLDINLNLEIDAKEAVFLLGTEVNTKMKNLAGDDTSSLTSPFSFIDYNITAIQYSESEPISANKEEKNIVSKPDSEYPIYMWYENGIIYWWSEDKTPALQEDSAYFLYKMINLKNIEGLSKWNMSDVKTTRRMFAATGIEDLHALQNWNTSNVRNMNYMFYYDTSISNLEGLENWNTSNATNMAGLFKQCTTLSSLEGLENWNTSNVEDMGEIFLETKINSVIPLQNWDTSNVNSLIAAFQMCTELLSLEGLENWNTSKLENMSFTFDLATSLTDVDAIKNWDVSKVVTMRQLFCSNVSLESIDLSNWKTDSLVDMCNLFGMWNSNGTSRYDAKLKTIKLSKDFNTSKVTDMNMVFTNLPLLETIEGIEYWDTSQVTGMYSLFAGCNSLTTLDLSSFDTRKVTYFTHMFDGCKNLEVIYVGENWSTESNAEATSPVFASTMKLANFNANNEAYRDLRWAHAGEGGYLTLKTS